MYLRSTPNPSGAYGALQSKPVPGLLTLPDSLLDEFLEYNGFVTLTVQGGEVTALTPNPEAREVWRASVPPAAEPEPTEIEIAQQAITDLELADIEQGQAITDLELTIMEGQANV